MNVRMKTTTVLLADGKRISWFNTTHVRIYPIEGGYEFRVYWKYKASIKEEIFTSPMKENELNKYFARFGIIPLTKNLYVNLAKITIVKEEQVYGPVEKTRVEMIFVDGFQFKELIEASQWSWWKQSYM